MPEPCGPCLLPADIPVDGFRGAALRQQQGEFAIAGCGTSTVLTPLKIFEYFEMAS
jgi:hypothetical protein